MIYTLKNLPEPPKGKIGFPWTEESPPPQYIPENLPKITIITPSFNQGQYIEETIRSIFLQHYPHLEYIIIDGGSSDETVEIIKKYEKFIDFWVSEPDNGQTHAINKGLHRATGQFFNWINSDDMLLPNALWNLARKIEKHPDIDVFCGQKNCGFNLNDIKAVGQTQILGSLEATLAKGLISQEGTFFRRETVEKLGFLNENFVFTMDSELFTRYLAHYGQSAVMLFDTPLAFFRLHPASKSSNLKTVELSDRFNIATALLNSISEKYYFLRHNKTCKMYYNYPYNLDNYNKKALALFIINTILDRYTQIMDWRTFGRLYFLTLLNQPFKRPIRVYFAPLFKLKRVFLPIK